MSTEIIREKLYSYIKVADDKKVKAIYTMLESEITTEVKWWNNHGFIKELEGRFQNWKTGKSKGYSLAQIENEIVRLKKKRAK